MAYPLHQEITSKNLIDYLYPINSIYININDINPKTLFGEETEWEKLPSGLLRGIGNGVQYSSDSQGSIEHGHPMEASKITLPEHTHSLSMSSSGKHTHTHQGYWSQQYGGAISVLSRGDGGGSGRDFGMNAGGNHTHTISIYSEGSDTPHNHSLSSDANILPPYTKVYMWKRTK